MVDQGVPWENVIAHGTAVVLHDPLCPMTPPGFIADCVDAAVDRESIVVAVRPVTDTVKESTGTEDGVVGATVDRDRLVTVCSPIVLPVDVVAEFDDGLPTTDFVRLVEQLRETHDVAMLDAPVEAQRVSSAEDLSVLAARTGPSDDAVE